MHDLKRLSWPEGREFWVANDMSWMAYPTATANGVHKEWHILCLRDAPEKGFEAGDSLDETYSELYEAKNALRRMMSE